MNMHEKALLGLPAPEPVSDEPHLKLVIRSMALAAGSGHLLFFLIFLWLNIWQMAAFNVGSCCIFAACFWLNQRGRSHDALLIGVVEIVAHAALAVAYLGWGSGFHYYILGQILFIFYSKHWRMTFKIAQVVFLSASYLTLFAFSANTQPWAAVHPGRIQAIAVMNILITFVGFAALAQAYWKAVAVAEAGLKSANQLLTDLAHTDPLTRISNRREMETNLLQAMESYQIHQIPFSVILGDINDFKVFNDRYGHEAGDFILVTVANLMSTSLRSQDRVARWGGDEFLMLLTATDLSRARPVAERLCEKIAATRIRIGTEQVSFTVAFGVAEYREEADPAACIQRADEDMYRHKRLLKHPAD
jgi:diguanylate cyclase (GGDEF)-like protein